jgi:hypothetical protein
MPRFFREVADMSSVSSNAAIGPLLMRGAAYVFDTWNSSEGRRSGFPYRRIEDAHYARNAVIRAAAHGTLICQTEDEFVQKTTLRAMPLAA